MDDVDRGELQVRDRGLLLESEVLFGLPGFDQVARSSQYVGFKGLIDIMKDARRVVFGERGESKKIREAPRRGLLDQDIETGWKKYVAGWVLKDLQDMGRDDVVGRVEDAATRLDGLIDSTGGTVGVEVSATRGLLENVARGLPAVMRERGLPVGQLPEMGVFQAVMKESADRVWKESSFSANPNVGTNLREYSESMAGLIGDLQLFGQVLMQAQHNAGSLGSGV